MAGTPSLKESETVPRPLEEEPSDPSVLPKLRF